MEIPDEVQIERGQRNQGPDRWLIKTPEGVYTAVQAESGLWRFSARTADESAQDATAGYAWQAPGPADERQAGEVYRQFRLWQVERADPHPDSPREDEVM
jgi:hypothetical protein